MFFCLQCLCTERDSYSGFIIEQVGSAPTLLTNRLRTGRRGPRMLRNSARTAREVHVLDETTVAPMRILQPPNSPKSLS